MRRYLANFRSTSFFSDLAPFRQGEIIWLAVASFTASLLALSDEALSLPAVLAVASLSVALQTGFLSFALWLPSRFRSGGLSVLWYLGAGLTRGAILVMFGSYTESEILLQVVNSTVASTLWGVVFSRLLSDHRQFKRSFQRSAVALAIREARPGLDSVPEFLQLKRWLAELSERIRRDPSEAERLLAAITSEVRVILNPLRERLVVTERIAPAIGLIPLLRAALLQPSPNSRFVVAVWVLLNLSGALTLYDGLRALISVAVGGLVIWFVLRSVQSVSQPAIRQLLILGSVVSSALVPDLLLQALGFESGFGNLLITVVSPIVLLIVIWISSAWEQLKRDRDAALVLLSQQSSSEALQFDDFVHNTIQGQITALLAKFVTAGPSSPLRYQELLQDLEQFQSTNFDELLKEHSDQPAAALALLSDGWRSVLALDLSQFKLTDTDTFADASLVSCLEEAVANAYRHSGARSVEGKTEWIGQNRLRLTVISDRTRWSKKRGIGGGGRTLNRLSLNWELRLSRSSSVLEADFLVSRSS